MRPCTPMRRSTASARLSVAYNGGISAGPETGRDSTPRCGAPSSSRVQLDIALPHVERPAGDAQAMTRTPSMSSTSTFSRRCQAPEAARRVAGARSVHLDRRISESGWSRSTPWRSARFGQQRWLVLPRRDEGTQQRRCAAALRRLHALLRQQDDADDAASCARSVRIEMSSSFAAMKERHRSEDVVAADHRHDPARSRPRPR